VEELYRVVWNENCGGCVSMEQKSFALLNVLGVQQSIDGVNIILED